MLRKLALSLVSLLVALLAAELLIRIADEAPEVSVIRKGRFQLSRNPKIGFEPVPGLRYEAEDLSFHDYQGLSNRLGYRDRDHEVAKPDGVWRIVVLGDSIAAGLRVRSFEDTFPAILEKLLQEQGVNAEVISLAVSGYNTQQEVETLIDKGLQYQPDLVLVAYSLTDRERLDGDILRTLLEAERAEGRGSVARTHPLLLQSALYRVFRYRVLPPRPASASSDREIQRLTDQISGDTVAEYFGVLDRLARREGFQVLIAVFPRLVPNFARYRFKKEHRFVHELSAEHGFVHLDLIDAFDRCRQEKRRIGADGYHPSAVGHRCAAEAMARVILDEIRPPRR